MFQTSFGCRRNSRTDCSPTECKRIASINITNNDYLIVDCGIPPFDFTTDKSFIPEWVLMAQKRAVSGNVLEMYEVS